MKILKIKDRIMKIRSWKSVVFLVVGLFIGILMDAIVTVTGWYLIGVGEDYSNEVFGAICTVAVLGNAMLSLLFGSFDKLIRGIPIQDILDSSEFGDDQWLTIVTTTASIIVAVYAYAENLCTTLSIIVCADAFLILCSSYDLWRLLSNKKKQSDVVNEIIARAPATKYSVYISNWFDELECALTSNNEYAVQDFFELINELTVTKLNEEHEVNEMIAQRLPKFFEQACEKIGFTDAYTLFRKVNHIRPNGFVDSETIALEYIMSLKYVNIANTHNRNLPKIIKEIIDEMDISVWEKRGFAHQYVCALFYNPYFDNETKTEIMSEIMDDLCRLNDDREDDVRKDTLLSIIRNDVLWNDNYQTNIDLFNVVTESLIIKNQHAKDMVFISTIAEVFMAFFFYVFREVETLSVDYRDHLHKVYQSRIQKKDLVTLSFNNLLYANCKEIAMYLADIAVAMDWRKSTFWDYYGPTTGFKRVVWSKENAIQFAFCFYKMVEVLCDYNPFISMLMSDDYDNDIKLSICEVVTNLYDQGHLNDQAYDIIKEIEDLTGISVSRSEFRDVSEHDYFQETLTKLLTDRNTKIDEKLIWPISEMNQRVVQKLGKNGVFEYTSLLPLKPATHRIFAPIMVAIGSNQPEQSADRIARLVKTIMNDVISRKLENVVVDFGLGGVQNLLEALNNGVWKYRNYKHINDYAIPSSVRETTLFVQLCDVLAGINYDGSHEITPYVFLKKDKLLYNLDIHYHLENPSEEECAKFVDKHQIADGVYKIGTSRFDHAHAINHVRNNYRLEFIELFVRVDINRDSGFKVEFDRKK